MWKRFSGSLTLRIFLITTVLLMAACALTYGAIAYLTPISYISLMEDELGRESIVLVENLEAGNAEDGQAAILEFTRRTGAEAMLFTVGSSEALYEGTGAVTSVVEDEVITEVLEDKEAEEHLTEGIIDVVADDSVSDTAYMQVTVTSGDSALTSDVRYDLQFIDGERGELVVRGGMRAVNRATEAMRRVLPYLALGLLAFSLAGSFFYARFITRPVVEISDIAGRIANLDFRARWTRRRRDEIGALGESLNRLSDNLSGALDELQSANDALRRDIERERELERQRLAFFSATSHELKTPVTILKGQLSGMLAQVGAYRDREKYLARSLEVVGRMESLIRQILTISRVESGAAGIGDERVNLSALLEGQLAQDAELLNRRELRVTREIAPNVILRGSERLLSAALDNVLMNAILYSPEGAEIRVALSEEGFSVENTGASLSEADLPHLFEPFYRVEQSRSRKSGGSGLGLYLVRSILRLHGAECEIKNTSEGVRFTARLTRE